jgi:hypothetical protein
LLPQRLKPDSLLGFNGTPEGVPLQSDCANRFKSGVFSPVASLALHGTLRANYLPIASCHRLAFCLASHQKTGLQSWCWWSPFFEPTFNEQGTRLVFGSVCDAPPRGDA